MIDHLEQHEALLRAIFADREADTPRLVYADWLDDHGQADRAELIRVQCELRRLRAGQARGDRVARLEAREAELIRRVVPEIVARPVPPHSQFDRGFWYGDYTGMVRVAAEDLDDPQALRGRVVTQFPHWYEASGVSVAPGRPLGPDEVNALFDLPFTQQVTDWDLGGLVEEVAGGPDTEDAGTYGLIDLIERPVITLAGVEALAAHRGARRIRRLVLTHNRLGNDAVRALARSTNLIRLERLDFRDGNTPRGRVWQELYDKYGEQVVG